MQTLTLALCLVLLFGLAHATPMPNPQCWTETKKCRYIAVAGGYECRDDYIDRSAVCHPKMKYRKKCDKAVYTPKVPQKPADYVKWEQIQSTLVAYDPNYGPHIKGYPSTKQSNYYFTKKLPTKPHGVTALAVPPPAYTTAPVHTAAPTSMPVRHSPLAYTVPKATKAPAYTAPTYTAQAKAT